MAGAWNVQTFYFNQNGAKETGWITVPEGAVAVRVSLPQLNSCALQVQTSFDGGTTIGSHKADLDGNTYPRTGYTGGSSTVNDILWLPVDGPCHIRLVSNVDQTGLSAQVKFQRKW